MYEVLYKINPNKNKGEINYEVNSIFYNEEISQSIRNQFYKDLDFCEEIKEENLKKTVFWRKIRNSLFRVVSPLM